MATNLSLDPEPIEQARKDNIGRFAALPLIVPERQDHVNAAELRNRCRRA